LIFFSDFSPVDLSNKYLSLLWLNICNSDYVGNAVGSPRLPFPAIGHRMRNFLAIDRKVCGNFIHNSFKVAKLLDPLQLVRVNPHDT
jgi:hypothetical protein